MRSSAVLIVLAAAGGLAFAQKPVLIQAARVLDVRGGAYLTNKAILVENERISEVADTATLRSRLRDATVIDLGEATVLPGLIDCHAHLLASMNFRLLGDALTVAVAQMSPSERALLGARNAREALEAGITSVRMVGHSGINGDSALRDAINRGWIPGPRIQAATRKLAPPGGQAMPLHSAVAKEMIDQELGE